MNSTWEPKHLVSFMEVVTIKTMEKLSEEEIERRMVEWRNFKRLYPELRERYEALQKENAQLRADLEQERRERKEEAETFKLRIEQLETMIFGRKKNHDDDDPYLPSPKNHSRKSRKRRLFSSYRRRTPDPSEVTEEKFHSIDICPDCREPLIRLTEVIRYEEDIVLPAMEHLKHVLKHRIETGFCPHCRRKHSSVPIAKQVCSLGENVRMRIVHCITVLGMTFAKVKTDLRDTFGMEVSDGEIGVILWTQARKLQPEYHDISARIRGSPCKHLDETSWPTQKGGEGHWAWVKTASDAPDTIFCLGRSRGKGNVAELHDQKGQPTVTDDYGAYDQLGGDQSLCWSHPKRKFEELAKSAVFSSEKRKHCQQFYKRFCLLFRAVKKSTETPYHPIHREKEGEKLRKRIERLYMPDPDDPKKLATLKDTFRKRSDAYLRCVHLPGIPLTNNKAERALRPLVIKRKLSFGSKTKKGADVMAVLLSVCFTTWWKCQESGKSFYEAYRQIQQKFAT